MAAVGAWLGHSNGTDGNVCAPRVWKGELKPLFISALFSRGR